MKGGENMKIDDVLKKRDFYKIEVGVEKYNNMVDGITKLARENDLDRTPTILKDLIEQIITLIQIENL